MARREEDKTRTTRYVARVLGVALLGWGVLLPAAAWAQGSSIAGVVTDSTGGVLPGVTVDAASPALIEGSRTAVTDGQGFYRVVDLRPGTYTLTFTLQGFNSMLREGIQLSAGFTATVNAQLSVGTVEETLTVSAASPVVDVQNVAQRAVITRDMLETLPVAKSTQSLVAIVPGLQVAAAFRDVGGSSGDRPVAATIHGSKTADMHVFSDGLRINNLNSGTSGGATDYSVYFNPASVSEISLETAQQAVTSDSGGVIVSVIPREGGNTLSGMFVANGTNGDLQSENLSADLQARGVTTVPHVKKIFDLNAGVGGPIRQDKVWFYTAYRRWGNTMNVGSKFFSADPLAWTSTPDRTREAYDENISWDFNGRITAQVTPTNKVSFVVDPQRRCLCYDGITGNVSPEASARTMNRSHFWQAKWSNTRSSRLLLQAGMGQNKMNWNYMLQPGIGTDVIAVQELSTGLTYRARTTYNSTDQDEGFNSSTYNMNFSTNYVAGSHALFVGTNVTHARPTTFWHTNGDRYYRFLNGQPSQIVLRVTPTVQKNTINDLAIYASDQWTMDRLTLTLGVRYSLLTGYVPEQVVPAGTFVPARTYPKVPDVVNWPDVTPRLGAVYDLTGDAKTALKVSVGKFLAGHGGDVVNRRNPQSTVADNATRSWIDANKDFIPNCDFLNPDANGECGSLSNRLFGQTTTPSTVYDDATMHGYGTRDYNWQIAAGVQRELMARVSVEATYFRRWYGNFLATDNRLVGPADFDTFCVTAPVDPRLPGGGGNQICGLYDIKREKFGRVDNLVTFADQFGERTEVYDGVDLTTNARLPRGLIVQGGLNIGRTATDECAILPDSPEKRFCHVTPKFLADVKLSVSYPLPFWEMQLSGTIQSSPGPEITASRAVPSSEVQQSLGRPLSSGSTRTVALVEPGTLYGDRLNQLDLRVAKAVRANRTTIRAMLDLYNLFNANPVLAQNNTYGPRWQQPLTILPGRLVKFGVQVDF